MLFLLPLCSGVGISRTIIVFVPIEQVCNRPLVAWGRPVSAESLSLAEVAGQLGGEALQRLRRECGGLQTLLRSNRQVFEGERARPGDASDRAGARAPRRPAPTSQPAPAAPPARAATTCSRGAVPAPRPRLLWWQPSAVATDTFPAAPTGPSGLVCFCHSAPQLGRGLPAGGAGSCSAAREAALGPARGWTATGGARTPGPSARRGSPAHAGAPWVEHSPRVPCWRLHTVTAPLPGSPGRGRAMGTPRAGSSTQDGPRQGLWRRR